MMLNELIATETGEVGLAWFDFYSIGHICLGIGLFLFPVLMWFIIKHKIKLNIIHRFLLITSIFLLINAFTFESVLGSIYIDQGYESCKKFVSEVLIPRIENIVENRLDIDAKTEFQEIAQARYRLTPTYKLVVAKGPDHEKTFTMAIMVGDDEFGRGAGPSKQKAEEKAAQKALEKVKADDKK